MSLRALLLTLALGAPLAAAAADKPKPMEAAPPPSTQLAPAEVSTQGRCDVSKKLCIDYEGDFLDGAAAAACSKVGGTFTDGSCSADGRLGTCFRRTPGSSERTLFRYYPPGDAKALKAECTKQPGSAWLVR
jgi:acyl dehydratase